MNRTVLASVVLLLLAATPLCAQEESKRGEWEIQMGLCYGLLDRIPYRNAEIGLIQERVNYSSGASFSYNGGHLIPTVSLSGGYVFRDPKIGVFMNVFFNYDFNTLTGGPYPLYEKECIWNFAPELRVYYSIRTKWRFYMSVGPSLRYRHFWETYKGDTLHERAFNITGHFAPICVAFGEKWFVSLDVGTWYLAKIDLGYRF